VRVLHRYGAIELVDTESIRGATKHIYAANRKMPIDGDDWLELPDEAQIGICANAIGEAVERARAAARAHVTAHCLTAPSIEGMLPTGVEPRDVRFERSKVLRSKSGITAAM
jgi:hypothetical protein